jgi:hypothetical protein
MYGDEVMSMLTVQYRMHELIMNWSSKELYSSKVLRSCLDVRLRSILLIMDCKKFVIFVKNLFIFLKEEEEEEEEEEEGNPV